MPTPTPVVITLLNPLKFLSTTDVGKFSLGDAYSNFKIQVKYTYVVTKNGVDTVFNKRDHFLLDKCGNFKIEFPEDTSMVKLKVVLKLNGCTELKGTFCFPEQLAPLLNQTQLSTRLTISNCNVFSINCSGYDHAHAKEQAGPGRSSRAIVMVHLAMFETLNAIEPRYTSYLSTAPIAPTCVELNIAICQAMCVTLKHLFPDQTNKINAHLSSVIGSYPNGTTKTNSLDFGKSVADVIIALRTNDGSQVPETSYADYIAENPPGSTPGLWTKDPVSQFGVALGYKWGEMTPFAIASGSTYRCPPFPSLTSPEYAAAFNEVKALGGDGITTPTVRSQELTNVGLYWAYDGTPSLCAPPRLYNQIALQLANQENLDYYQTLRMLTLVNLAMADAGVSSWDSKWFYKIWRPVTGVRETHYDGTSAPTGNSDIISDPTYTPIGAPNTNTSGVYFTPPFPAYPSGHATFGGALFQMLRNILGRDDISFTFVSDELNGVTQYDGTTRPFAPRSFTSLSQAEEENGQSRIYLGIHWSQDKVAGINQGRQVADYVFNNIYKD